MFSVRLHFTLMFMALSIAGCAAARPETAPAPAGWSVAYDLDGDGARDRITSEFSGGAHCCYTFGVELSSRGGELVMLPFWFDGGYAGGMDLIDIPERFAIRTGPSGAPEIHVAIATYNGRPEPLEPEWLEQYGIRSHCVAVSFPGGRVRVRNRDERLDEGGFVSCPLDAERGV